MSLPARILAELERAPGWTSGLAATLGARTCSVSAALTRLQQRGLVARVGEEPGDGPRPRVMYALAAAAADEPAARDPHGPGVLEQEAQRRT